MKNPSKSMEIVEFGSVLGLWDGEERLADVERAAEEERQALQQQLAGPLSCRTGPISMWSTARYAIDAVLSHDMLGLDVVF